VIKNQNRNTQLSAFLEKHLGKRAFTYQAITSDASFRQYYRVNTESESLILMDSPPDLVDNQPFVELQKNFSQAGLLVPKVIASDLEAGFILLNDLGSEHLADRLQFNSRLKDYEAVLELLPSVATIPTSCWMKPYDAEFIRFEMNILKEWLIEKWLNKNFSDMQLQLWQKLEETLVSAMLEQPQVTMHRDFHSRNIMNVSGEWALIDFQDAVRGPVSYDAVSLLKDCYFTLPTTEFNHLLKYNFEIMKSKNLLGELSFQQYNHYFDLTGLQRHLKAAGIFCRLLIRDNKSGYLNNILPTLQYVLLVCSQYEEFQWLATWLDNEIIPSIKLKLEQLP
jgi:aminoglycoside/choline kinase family phosphotransferase